MRVSLCWLGNQLLVETQRKTIHSCPHVSFPISYSRRAGGYIPSLHAAPPPMHHLLFYFRCLAAED